MLKPLSAFIQQKFTVIDRLPMVNEWCRLYSLLQKNNIDILIVCPDFLHRLNLQYNMYTCIGFTYLKIAKNIIYANLKSVIVNHRG